MIYNYLFVHSYILALRSKSNQDMPLFIPAMLVTMCFILNIFSITFFLEGLGILGPELYKVSKYIAGPLILGLIFFYYLYKKRYKRIFESYKARHDDPPPIWHSIMVVVLYYLVSVFIVFIAAFYRNKDWIFSV